MAGAVAMETVEVAQSLSLRTGAVRFFHFHHKDRHFPDDPVDSHYLNE